MKIGIIGCGNMGQALLRGIIASSYARNSELLVSDKDKRKRRAVCLRFKVGVTPSNSELVTRSKVIILAVKPQDLDEVAGDIAVPLKGKLVISICAGISTARLQSIFGKISVVRVMPNMPAVIAQGISALCSGRYVDRKQRKLAVSIFSCVGEVVQLKEELMDVVTAISGSGPAYFFYLVENLIFTARRLGIPPQTAERLVVKTALGSVLLLDQSKRSAVELRKRISSKGGTTEAAFALFKKQALDNILQRGFQAAAKRSKQLRKKRKG